MHAGTAPLALVTVLSEELPVLASFPAKSLVPDPALVPDPPQPVMVCCPHRLLGHEKVAYARMVQLNWAGTAARFRQSAVGLSIVDTTEVHFNGQDGERLGRLCLEALRGMSLHPSASVLPNQHPFGKADGSTGAIASLGKNGRPGGS